MLDQMREDWDARARLMHSLAFCPRGEMQTSPARFYEEGEHQAVQLMQPILATIGFKPTASRILEIGSGLGRFFPGFLKLGFEQIWGLDISPEMVRLATDICPVRSAHFVLGSGKDLAAFEDNSFDYCFSYTVFQHIPDKDIVQIYFREIFRVLRPGGAFQLQFRKRRPVLHSVALALPERYAKRAQLLYQRAVGAPLVPGGVRTWCITPMRPKMVTGQLARVGFSRVEILPDPSHSGRASSWAIGEK
jgi:ubiquinone/menaquinone biosynthesis C-methylase UbiE